MKKYVLFILFLFPLISISSTAIAAEVQELIIQPGPDGGKDTYYGIGSVGGQEGRPDATELRIGGWGDKWMSYIQFDLSTIPTNAIVQSAELGLYNRNVTNPNEGKLFLVTEEWNESDPSIADSPTFIDVDVPYTPVPNQDWWIVNVKDFVTDWVSGTVINYGLHIEGKYHSNNNVISFYSSDYTDNPASRPYLKVTYTLPQEEEDEVDPLVLQYAPTLAMHDSEDYLPMDVETYVEGSGLWDAGGFGARDDVQLRDAGSLTTAEFESLVGTDDTGDYYLAYSDPETAGSIDLDAARTKYDTGNTDTVLYYRKMNDGEYTVLQYWYFYAMNNWKEHGGLNDHEGDWESVFVYLDKDTQEPEYVAYSAHHNDGDPSFNELLQYDSVRRSWDSSEVEKNNSQVVSYVARGSHANYPNNNNGTHYVRIKTDVTSATGMRLAGDDFVQMNQLSETQPFWMAYQGLWGTNTFALGGDGPKGPVYSNVSGHLRYSKPVEWAGIDLIQKKILDILESVVTFSKSGIEMVFAELAQAEQWIQIDPHKEEISFGERQDGVTLLPEFWDITSSLDNGTFEVEVRFPYDPEMVGYLGGDARRLAVYFYNTVEDTWQRQESDVDVLAHTVSLNTTHFSRYALGFTQEEVTLEDLFGQLIQEVKATDLQKYKKRSLVRYIRLIERITDKDHRYTKKVTRILLKNVTRRIRWYEKRGKVRSSEAEEMYETIDEINAMLRL